MSKPTSRSTSSNNSEPTVRARDASQVFAGPLNSSVTISDGLLIRGPRLAAHGAPIAPAHEIIFLDTGGHFPETLEFASRIEREWDLNLTSYFPSPEAKAGPVGRAVLRTSKGRAARRAVKVGRVITSVKRVGAPTRAPMKICRGTRSSLW